MSLLDLNRLRSMEKHDSTSYYLLDLSPPHPKVVKGRVRLLRSGGGERVSSGLAPGRSRTSVPHRLGGSDSGSPSAAQTPGGHTTAGSPGDIRECGEKKGSGRT